MLIFSTSLFLCVIAVSEQQARNADFEKQDLPIENAEEILNRTTRNTTSTKQIASKIKEALCSDQRSIYDSLGYQARPEIFAPSSLNQWKPVTPILDEEDRIAYDPKFSQHQLKDTQKLPQSALTGSTKKITISKTTKVPEKITERNAEMASESDDINTHKHIPHSPPKSQHYEQPIQEDYKTTASEEIPDYIFKHDEATKFKYQKQPILVEHLTSKTEPSPPLNSEEQPEHILIQRHEEVLPYYSHAVKLSEIDLRSNKPAKSIEDKEESTEPYNYERRAYSEVDEEPTSEELQKYISKHNKTKKIKLGKHPIHVDHLDSESEASHASEELPEHILKYNHDEAISYYFEISTVKSIEPYSSETSALFETDEGLPTSAELQNYIKKHNTTNKIKVDKHPTQVNYLESESEELPEHILKHNHNEPSTYFLETSTAKSSDINKKTNKQTQSSEEEATELYIHERKSSSKPELPYHMFNYNKTEEGNSESNIEPNSSEDLPEHIHKHNHGEIVSYYFEISTTKSFESENKSSKSTKNIKENEEPTEKYISEKRTSSESDVSLPLFKDLPNDIHEHKKTTEVELLKQTLQEDYLESETEQNHLLEKLPEYFLNHRHDEAVPYYYGIPPHESKKIIEDKEESTEPYIFEKRTSSESDVSLPMSKELQNYIHEHKKTTKVELLKQPLREDYLESETELSHLPEKLPEYFLNHSHDEAVPYYYGIPPLGSKKSIKDEEELTEPYISEKITSSESGVSLPMFNELQNDIHEHKKTTKFELLKQPLQEDYLESETELRDISEKLPEYFLNHGHDEAVPYYYGIPPLGSKKSIKNEKESTEPYISEKTTSSESDVSLPMNKDLPNYIHEHKKTTKVELLKQPLREDYLESETELSNISEKLPEYFLNHSHDEAVPYYYAIPPLESKKIIEDKEESTEPYISGKRTSSESDVSLPILKELPNYIHEHNKTTKVKLLKQPLEEDYLESETEPGHISEELPRYIIIHNKLVKYYFDISSEKSFEKLNKPTENSKDEKELTETNTSTNRVQILNKTENHQTAHKHSHIHSTSAAPDSCILNTEDLSPESRRSLGNELGTEPLTGSKNKSKISKTIENVHDNQQKELSNKINTDTDRSTSFSRANIVPLRSNTFSAFKPGIRLQPTTYHLLDPTKGAGISPLSDPKTLMMESTKVCYACSTLNDASCWSPDRTTTVKYCRPGYDLCVTKIYEKVSTIGKIVIRDCNSACAVNTPGLDTHYDSCAICKDDLCNNVSIENGAFTFSQSKILLTLVISFIFKSIY